MTEYRRSQDDCLSSGLSLWAKGSLVYEIGSKGKEQEEHWEKRMIHWALGLLS